MGSAEETERALLEARDERDLSSRALRLLSIHYVRNGDFDRGFDFLHSSGLGPIKPVGRHWCILCANAMSADSMIRLSAWGKCFLPAMMKNHR